MKTTKHFFFPSLTLFLTSLTLLFVAAAQAQVPSYVPTNGLVGYWPFNGNANDESGNGNNGILYNSPELSGDRYNNANSSYLLDGIDDWINTPSALLQLSNAHSISIWWLTTDSTKALQTIFNSNPHTLENFAFHYSSQGIAPYGLSFGLGNGQSGGGSWNVMHPDDGQIVTPSTNSNWHNTVWIKDDLLNWKFYFDGQLLYNYTAAINIGSQLADIRFGAENNGFPTGGANFKGKLDDIGIWNRALTADEVLALYNGCNVSPLAVSGNVTPTQFTQETYTYPNTAGSTYNWTVTNGVIVSGQGSNSIDVMWANTGIGSVSVVETNASNCTGDIVNYDVVVIPTNIEELSNAMILYPNPATIELNLQTTSDLIGTDLFVFDALGKQILKQQILSTSTIINTSSFAAGNYVVKVGGGVKKFEVVR